MVLDAYGSQSLIMCTELKAATFPLTLFKFPLTLHQLNDLQSSLFLIDWDFSGCHSELMQISSTQINAITLFSFTFPAVRYF